MKTHNLYLLASSLMLATTCSFASIQQQQPFSAAVTVKQVQGQDKTVIHGKYLHITDIHMDKHYLSGAMINSDCHRAPKKHKKKKQAQGLLAGYWGAPNTDCDAPPRLVYHSIDYIANEWKDKIDFVIWTGDNARHDGDELITRTKKEIVGYNEKVTLLLKNAFKLDNGKALPIVPCIGNNDVHPHNQFRGMKNNPQLLEFSEMWNDLIPSDQQKSFKRGGYFAVDVVPGIRILSLNTLYFFGSNDVVNSCSDIGGPGARHVQWLKKQLKRARRDGVKVILIGHVPPTLKTFKDACLDDYIKLSTKNADIITGHMFGHANMDHFQVLSRGLTTSDLDEDDEDDEELMEISKDNSRFISTLRKQYKKVKKYRDQRDQLVVVHVAPPMIPLFYPTFRINEYNANQSSPEFGNWLKYTQWYTNLTYWNEARHVITRKHLSPEFQIEYATDIDYNMIDLTVGSWLDLAERLGQKKNKQTLWKTYLTNMFVQTNNEWYEQSVPLKKETSSWWNWFYNGFIKELFV